MSDENNSAVLSHGPKSNMRFVRLSVFFLTTLVETNGPERCKRKFEEDSPAFLSKLCPGKQNHCGKKQLRESEISSSFAPSYKLGFSETSSAVIKKSVSIVAYKIKLI